MKTPEEIRLAVLKECGRRVDADDTTIIVGERPVWLYACNHLIDENGKLKLILVSTEKDSWEKGYTINSLGMNLHLWSGATDQEWAFAYRLLNLEAKEIEEKLGLMTISRDNGKILRESCEKALDGRDTRIKELEEKYNDLLKLSNQIQEKVDTLEERAQGLVDALEEIVTSNGYGEGVGAEFQAIAETALNQWKGGGK